ncbi:discoidin domain-containing protein [Pedobacter glucosidilyticus]|uniref:discoidin domain-containing protein n=1 Tax=Pedobacter glucosidilyticus TaxID=1122941 RepID=UPI00041DE0F6|nr:discoidin domain-containing protein [Pedobacter glucosidilyticus]
MKLLLSLSLFCIISSYAIAKEKSISLAGQWRFEIADATYPAFNQTLKGKIRLPGTIDDAGIGPKNTATATLEGPYRKFNYAGPVYYQREIEIPKNWKGKRISLFLERCRWTTKVWIDDQYLGTQESLVAPHTYEFGTNIKPGKHKLTICVDNTVKLDLGRFVSALFGGTWGNMNGIIGRIALDATPPVWIHNIQVYPNIAKKNAVVKVGIGNVTGRADSGVMNINGKNIKAYWDKKGGQAEVEIDMSTAKLWDEFTPNMSKVMVRLGDDERNIQFGMREFGIKESQFILNGRPIYLRGTLECSIWPLTGYPPTDVEAWKRIYKIMKSYGLNSIRFHSWTPPEAAFIAADQEGIIVQTEAPQANVAAGQNPERDKFIEAELKRIVDTYGNHPSFCLMTPGNEYGGKDEVLSRWVQMLITHDSRHVYSSPSNAQKTQNRQFTVTVGGRGIFGPGTFRDLRNAVIKEKIPIIGHEIGEWMYYPDFKEIKKWNGVMELKNFEMIRDDLNKKNLLDQAPKYVEASGKFATLLYKEEIEVHLRTPGYGGFQLLDLHDYPTQGTALVGPLDAFWKSKGFVTPNKFREYCSSTVPLLRMPKRTYTQDESFNASIDVAHYGSTDLSKAQVHWKIKDERGHLVDEGNLKSDVLPTGKLSSIGNIQASLLSAKAPCKLTVTVSLTNGVKAINSWDIWVYPTKVVTEAPSTVTVCNRWDVAKKMLESGKKVVFFTHHTYTKSSMPGRFLPVFWSPIWFPTQRPNTMGLLCNPDEPFFAKFPTENQSNWQWFNLMENARFFNLDSTPAAYRPIIQVIDNFKRNHKLGVVFEATVGKGKLLVCGFDPTAAPEDAACRQFLSNLYDYAGSDKFEPTQELNLEILDKLFTPEIASIISDSFDAVGKRETFKPENAIDGDPITSWQSKGKDPVSPYPHELILELYHPTKLKGLTCLPARDPEYTGEKASWIKDYAIFVSDDGKKWEKSLVEGAFSYDNKIKTILFPEPVAVKFLKLVALNGFNPKDPKASLAEITLIKAD